VRSLRLFVTWSCHLILSIFLSMALWAELGLCAIFLVVVHVSAPWRNTGITHWLKSSFWDWMGIWHLEDIGLTSQTYSMLRKCFFWFLLLNLHLRRIVGQDTHSFFAFSSECSSTSMVAVEFSNVLVMILVFSLFILSPTFRLCWCRSWSIVCSSVGLLATSTCRQRSVGLWGLGLLLF